jgi:hypothetical protein
MTVKDWLKGIAAGIVATVALSVLMVLKQQMGLVPQLNPIEMLTGLAGASTPAMGWLLHFLIGTVVWGTLFLFLDASLPQNSHWINGILLGISAWLLVMIAVMPLAGAGLFGLAFGAITPIVTLVLHVIYGAVLGGIYGLEHPEATGVLQMRLH